MAGPIPSFSGRSTRYCFLEYSNRTRDVSWLPSREGSGDCDGDDRASGTDGGNWDECYSEIKFFQDPTPVGKMRKR